MMVNNETMLTQYDPVLNQYVSVPASSEGGFVNDGTGSSSGGTGTLYTTPPDTQNTGGIPMSPDGVRTVAPTQDMAAAAANTQNATTVAKPSLNKSLKPLLYGLGIVAVVLIVRKMVKK